MAKLGHRRFGTLPYYEFKSYDGIVNHLYVILKNTSSLIVEYLCFKVIAVEKFIT